MTRRRSSLTLAILLAIGASLAVAGCLGGPEETSAPQEVDGLPTGEREADVATPAVGCTEASDAPAGYGSTGSVQEGEVGTGFGDIGSPTSCVDNPENGTTKTGQVEPHEPVQTYPDPEEIPSSQDAGEVQPPQ